MAITTTNTLRIVLKLLNIIHLIRYNTKVVYRLIIEENIVL